MRPSAPWASVMEFPPQAYDARQDFVPVRGRASRVQVRHGGGASHVAPPASFKEWQKQWCLLHRAFVSCNVEGHVLSFKKLQGLQPHD